MHLLFVRHGLPERVVTTDGSPADPPLSPVGRAQAEAVARWLADEPVDHVYSSPMRRARQTAEPLEAQRSTRAVVRDGLSEFDRESHAYIPLEELKATDRDSWLDIVQNMGRESGDPARFRGLVVDAVETIVADHPGQRVALVCHGGVINAWASHVLGIPAERMFFFEPAYTSINRFIAASSGERSLHSLNERAHLRGI